MTQKSHSWVSTPRNQKQVFKQKLAHGCHNCQKMDTTQISINWWTDEKVECSRHGMWPSLEKDLLIFALMWVSLRNTVRKEADPEAHRKIPSTWHVQKGPINTQEVDSWVQGWERAGGEWLLCGQEISLFRDEKVLKPVTQHWEGTKYHRTVHLRWLKLFTLSYVYFTTMKQINWAYVSGFDSLSKGSAIWWKDHRF